MSVKSYYGFTVGDEVEWDDGALPGIEAGRGIVSGFDSRRSIMVRQTGLGTGIAAVNGRGPLPLVRAHRFANPRRLRKFVPPRTPEEIARFLGES